MLVGMPYSVLDIHARHLGRTFRCSQRGSSWAPQIMTFRG